MEPPRIGRLSGIQTPTRILASAEDLPDVLAIAGLLERGHSRSHKGPLARRPTQKSSSCFSIFRPRTSLKKVTVCTAASVHVPIHPSLRILITPDSGLTWG